MNIWSDLESALVAVAQASIDPSVEIILAYSNGPENVSPYCFIDVISDEQVGMAETNGLLSGISPSLISFTVKQFEATVRFNFFSKDTTASFAGDLAKQFDFYLTTPAGQDLLEINKLSLLEKKAIKKVPKLRETSWYNMYIVEITVAYQVTEEATATPIETVGITGLYDTGDSTITDAIVLP